MTTSTSTFTDGLAQRNERELACDICAKHIRSTGYVVRVGRRPIACFCTEHTPRPLPGPTVWKDAPRFQVAVLHGDLILSGGDRFGNTKAKLNGCGYVYDRMADRMAAAYPTEGRRGRTVEDAEALAEWHAGWLNASAA